MELQTESKQGAQRVITVAQLTASIKAILEGGFNSVTIKGEISNWKPASSGHIYFSLKDSEASISAALFRGSAMKAKLQTIKDGMEVICRGKISVYPPRGTYQIIVESLEAVGAGSLQAQFEALKKKLFQEGLFDSARKRSLPPFPSRIVVITSPTGAAIKDVLSVLKRRFSNVPVLILPALVQGEAAPKELVQALRLANEKSLGDVILLTRGGGSLEDLWCFNDETLAREIFQSKIPVVSAVGHEIDFTIADFVADLRAPTPSAAAEILVKEKQALEENLLELRVRLIQSAKRKIQQCQMQFKGIAGRIRNPKDRINELRLRFDEWAERLTIAMQNGVRRRRERLSKYENTLKALSPLRVLERGYAIAFDPSGNAIRSTKELTVGSGFSLRLSDGTIGAQVSSKEK